MSRLSTTLIDVGWGDSILIESGKNSGKCSYALIDSNDTATTRSSYIFLKKYFDKKEIKLPEDKPVFDFVLLTHAHADHGQGLKAILRTFGTKYFWYPKSRDRFDVLSELIRFSNRSSNVQHHQSIDRTKILPRIGDAEMDVLWPPYNRKDNNDNNNSVVLNLKLNNVSYLLTGDAEVAVWNQISTQIPNDTQFFKIPHHGSINGTFDNNNTPWYTNCPPNAHLAISSHVKPYKHPHKNVIELLENNNRQCYRTDEHFHLIFETDGTQTTVKYSHI